MSEVQQPTRPRRERPKALRLTDAAAEQVKAAMDKAEKPYVGIRIGLKNAGCAAMSYTMDFVQQYCSAIDLSDSEHGLDFPLVVHLMKYSLR